MLPLTQCYAIDTIVGMSKSIAKINNILQQNKKILITSHQNPDGDAVGSTLFLYSILMQLNYDVTVSFHTRISKMYSFLPNFNFALQKFPVRKAITQYEIGIIIFLDGVNLRRFSFKPNELKNVINKHNVTTICIDHHPPDQSDIFDLYINLHYASTCETLYEIFIKQLGFKLPEEAIYSLMTGIVEDTGLFRYKNPHHRHTFSVVSELLDIKLDAIEYITDKLGAVSDVVLRLVGYLISNMVVKTSYVYSFLTQEQIDNLQVKDFQIVSRAYHEFMGQYIRKVNGLGVGFVVIPYDKNTYKVSFRSASYTGIDVSKFAKALGGGGHNSAAGAEFSAFSLQEAINRVLRVMEKF